MTLTLRSAISDTDEVADILGSDTLDPGFVQVGQEYLEVIAIGTATPDFGDAAYRRCTIRRSQLGTMAAAHAADATITPIVVVVQTASPTSPPPGEAGGAQQVRLLGPYRINYNSANVENDTVGVPLFTLESDWIILDAWVRVITPWSGPTTAFLFCDTADNYDSLFPGGLDVKTGTEGETNDLGYVVQASSGVTHVGSRMELVQNADGSITQVRSVRLYPMHVLDPQPVIAYISRSGSAAVAGEADIYALIAEPAA